MGAMSLWRPFRDLERLARSWESRFPSFSQEFEEAEKEFAPPIESYVKDGNLLVRVDVPGLEPKDGVLLLEGELENIAAKKLALEHAAAVGGVSGIVDRLRITPATPMGDGEIRDHVRDALLGRACNQ